MPDLTPAETKAMAYWPQIEGSAARHDTTASLWASINAAAAELGLTSPGVSAIAVNRLRAMATGIQRRSDQLAALPNSKRLTSGLVSQAPWSRSLAEQRALPKFQARFQHTFTKNGDSVTEWRTSVWDGKLPRTIGQLRDAIDLDAQNMANKYGVEHDSVDAIQLFQI